MDALVDSGTVTVTRAGIIFAGRNQTRVCEIQKIVGPTARGSELDISVSNRQKVTRLRLRADVLQGVQFALTVLSADLAGHRGAMITDYEHQLTDLEAAEPQLQIESGGL